MTNVIVIGGRLTANAELKHGTGGFIVCNFNLANNRKKPSGEETTFINVSIYGKYAEVMHPYLVKGVVVDVVGELIQKDWQVGDKNIPIHKISAKEIDFRIPKNKQNNEQNSPQGEEIDE